MHTRIVRPQMFTIRIIQGPPMPGIELKIKSRDIHTLVEIIQKSNPGADISLVRKAYEIAEAAHRGQSRLSGEPYITHPLEVAIILARLNMDTTTICAALLHDVVEDTEKSMNAIRTDFGDEIGQLVDGVTKISTFKKQSKEIEQAHNLRKMLLATFKDIRVILIKLADKLHNMRTIMFQPEHKQEEIANEVLDIYAPLAGRLGISKIRAELEDLAFQVLNPQGYESVREKIALRKNELETYIETIRGALQKKFGELSINAEIVGRVKHFYSIFKKMRSQKKSFDDIYDIRAIRIITDEVRDCYGALGIIHTLWTPITARFKDYIAVPKSNMYQSLHTTVMGPDGHPLEFQIRTYKMHRIAEMGIAAHWLYKESPETIDKNYKNLALLKNINQWQSDELDSREFLKELKMDLHQHEIYVFTPKGRIITLSTGSTPIDFAYTIHTEVGNQCVGAKVNNRMVPLKTILKSGDIVEILTSKKGHPSDAWLQFVKSANARYKIRNWLRQHDHTAKPAESDERTGKKPKKTAEVSIPDQELPKLKKFTGGQSQSLSIDGTSNVMIKLSHCCHPIPGDEVIGFITRGRGITVHKKNCISLTRMSIEAERFINIMWENSGNTYPVVLMINALDRPNLLKDVAEEISHSKTNIIKNEAWVEDGTVAKFKFILEVRDLQHMRDIMARIRKIRNITNVYKLNEKVGSD